MRVILVFNNYVISHLTEYSRCSFQLKLQKSTNAKIKYKYARIRVTLQLDARNLGFEDKYIWISNNINSIIILIHVSFIKYTKLNIIIYT